jgi:hypothetical protein
LVSAALPLLLAGCQTVDMLHGKDAGATGWAYVHWPVVQRYSVPLPLLRRAAIEAMTDMGINAVKEHEIPDGVVFAGRTYLYQKIWVHLQQVDDCTFMKVKVCVLGGDEPISKVLIDRTSVRLATQPRFARPPDASGPDPNMARDAAPDSIIHMGQDVAGYRGIPLR